MTSPLAEHPQRQFLHHEVHLRPGMAVPTPAQLTTLTLVDASATVQRAHLAALIAQLHLPEMTLDAVHYRAQGADFVLRWSLHGEFARITVMFDKSAKDFSRNALMQLPLEWLKTLPGRVVFAMHALVLTPAEVPESLTDASQRWFSGNALVGSRIAHGKAIAVSDLRLHHDALIEGGAARLLLVNHGIGKRLCGRMLQDLFEMETYRLMALMSFPLAKRMLPLASRLEDTLQRVTNALANGGEPETMQHELDTAAAELEDAIAASHYRFSATRAYATLMEKRLRDLHEQAFDTFPSFGEFMDRRMSPALATVESVRSRLQELSSNLQRTSSLLRNRIELQLLKQNQSLLAALNKRADTQLRLQQTVEGLSVAVLGYYAVSLLHYFLEALVQLGANVDVDLVTGMAVPVVLLALLWSLRRLHRKLARQSNSITAP